MQPGSLPTVLLGTQAYQLANRFSEHILPALLVVGRNWVTEVIISA